MSDDTSKFLSIIDNRIEKNLAERTDKYLKQRVGQVISYDEDTYKTYIVFPDDEERQTHIYYNKSAELLEENDYVRVYYTTNIDKGWIGNKTGEVAISNNNGAGLEPITAITINSDIDYTVSTNAGVERYIGILEGQ